MAPFDAALITNPMSVDLHLWVTPVTAIFVPADVDGYHGTARGGICFGLLKSGG
jgi:hypothetical protein